LGDSLISWATNRVSAVLKGRKGSVRVRKSWDREPRRNEADHRISQKKQTCREVRGSLREARGLGSLITSGGKGASRELLGVSSKGKGDPHSLRKNLGGGKPSRARILAMYSDVLRKGRKSAEKGARWPGGRTGGGFFGIFTTCMAQGKNMVQRVTAGGRKKKKKKSVRNKVEKQTTFLRRRRKGVVDRQPE